MNTLSLYPRILLVLAATALLTPIAGGYLISLLFLIWFGVQWARRRWWRGAAEATADAAMQQGWAYVQPALRAINWGVAALIAAQLVSSLGGWLWSDFSQPAAAAAKVSVHFALKMGLLWWVVSSALLTAWRRGWNPRRIGAWFLAVMVVHLVYVVAQRYTGIDWSHGVAARLGTHRFAYGVYRISGFMGHPLTLAYNLMLVVFAAAAMAMQPRQLFDARGRWMWAATALLALVPLLISGSRFVLVIMPLTVLVCEGKRLVRYWPWVLGACLVLVAALWLEGSVLGRFGEVFDQSVPLTERFPRLVFWQVHA